jgi:hypothetical protein
MSGKALSNNSARGSQRRNSNKVDANNIMTVSKFSDEPIVIQFEQRNSLAPNFQQPHSMK